MTNTLLPVIRINMEIAFWTDGGTLHHTSQNKIEQMTQILAGLFHDMCEGKMTNQEQTVIVSQPIG